MISCLRALAEWLERPKSRLGLRLLFITTAITLTLVPFIRFFLSGTDMDYRTWYDAGQTILRGGELYPQTQNFPFMYPPTCALFLAAPAFFGKPALILILTSLNTVAWILCIRLVSALIGEERIPNASIVLANFIVIPFVWSSYHLGQPSLLLLALMLGAFLDLPRGRKGQVAAGALIAVASIIKAFPFLAVFYLFYRRYWLAIASLVFGLLILLFVLPLPFRGLHRTVTDARDWQRGMLRYEESGIAQRPARGYSWRNQSILGVANRLLRRVSIDDDRSPPAYANVVNLDFRMVNVVIIVCALAVGISFVWVIPRQRSPASQEFAALLILILMFTPLAFGYLFVWLIFPLALLIKRIIAAGDVMLLTCLVVALVLLIATGIAPRFAQIYGSLFFTGLILYLALATDLRRGHVHVTTTKSSD